MKFLNGCQWRDDFCSHKNKTLINKTLTPLLVVLVCWSLSNMSDCIELMFLFLYECHLMEWKFIFAFLFKCFDIMWKNKISQCSYMFCIVYSSHCVPTEHALKKSNIFLKYLNNLKQTQDGKCICTVHLLPNMHTN